MSQLIKKGLSDNAVDGSKIKLSNDQYLKARNAANTADVNVIKLNASDVAVVGTSLLPAADNAQTLGDGSLQFSELYVNSIFNNLGVLTLSGTSVDLAGNLVSLSGATVGTAANRFLAVHTNAVRCGTTELTLESNGVSFVLPGADGSPGQILSTDGDGTLSWVTDASGAVEVSEKVTVTLAAGDITNQYYDLAHVAKTNSIMFIVKGLGPTLEGAAHDYSVNYTGGVGGKTRITFLNDLATGGASALIAGDIIQIMFVR